MGTKSNARKNPSHEIVRAAGRGCFSVKQKEIEVYKNKHKKVYNISNNFHGGLYQYLESEVEEGWCL